MVIHWPNTLVLFFRVLRMDRLSWILPIAVLVGLLGFGLLGIFLILRSTTAYNEVVLVNIAENIIHSLEIGIASTIQPAMAMHTMITHYYKNWSLINHTFYEIAPFILNNAKNGAIITIVLAPYAVAMSIYPPNLRGWERVIGLDLLQDPNWRTDALKTIKLAKNGMTMTGPVVLKAGPLGLVARSPVFIQVNSSKESFGFPENLSPYECDICYDNITHDKFWGFSQLNVDWNTLIYNVSDIFSSCRNGDVFFDLIYTHPVLQENETVASCGDANMYYSVHRTLNIMHNTWYLRIGKPGAYQPLWFTLAIIVLILISIIICGMTFVCMFQRRKYIWLVKSMLPSKVVKVLRKGGSYMEDFSCVTVLFSDIVSYTTMAASIEAKEVVKLLNELYGIFDELVDHHQCVKIETIGDAFMAACGVENESPEETACKIASLAIAMRKATQERQFNGQNIQIRIGIHSGPAVGAVIGFKIPHFCLCGDTINTASRMEFNSKPYKIHASKETANLLSLSDKYQVIPRGEIDVKGKGIMATYWIEEKDYSISPTPPRSCSEGGDEVQRMIYVPSKNSIDLRVLR